MILFRKTAIPIFKRFLLLFATLYSTHVFSQTEKQVHFLFSGFQSGNDSIIFRKKFSSFKSAKDSSDFIQKLAEISNEMKSLGYGLISVDSVQSNASAYNVWMYAGPKFKWVKLESDSIERSYLEGTPLFKHNLKNTVFDPSAFEKIRARILKNCENNGYPFASVKLNQVAIDSNLIQAKINLTKNSLVKIDSIIIKGNAAIAPVYIYNYIGIFPGDIYNESKLQRISNRLRELAFVKEIRASQVSFTEKLNRLYLFLENKKSSQFDGVIGFLPDENNQGKLNLTGEVHLKLQNSFKRGEVVELNWKQLPPRSQDLKVHLLYPFVFNSPFGVDANLSIFKRDTIFIDVIKNLGIQYSLFGNNFVKIFVNDKQSDLQSTKGLENITALPSYADVTTTSYGSTFHFEKLDYRINPMHGYAIECTASAGNRTIRKNSDINPLVYDSLRLKSTTYQLTINADFYQSLGGKNVLNIGGIASRIENPELFTNELYRIGGLRSLRGFDEESIFASTFAIGKIEYRYLLEQNSFLFLFYNQAWYERKRKNGYLNDTPLGFGGGINFETRLGIMSVSYALGKQGDNPIFFRNGKVHFGIVNYF